LNEKCIAPDSLLKLCIVCISIAKKKVGGLEGTGSRFDLR